MSVHVRNLIIQIEKKIIEAQREVNLEQKVILLRSQQDILDNYFEGVLGEYSSA